MKKVLLPLFLALAPTLPLHAEPWLPGTPPGKARSEMDKDSAVLGNAVLSARWDTGKLTLVEVKNGAGKIILQGPMQAFEMTVDGKKMSSAAMSLAAPPRIERLAPVPDAPSWARRAPGVALSATFTDHEKRIEVEWKAILRDGSNYLRQVVEIKALKSIELGEITLVDCPWDGEVVGTVTGSPIVSDSAFIAFESPLASNALGKDKAHGGGTRASCSYNRNSTMAPAQSFVCSSVIGVYPKGQLRRGFLHYLERERARSYRQYLHYNTWYDLNIGRPKNRMTEAEALASINAIGTELVKNRGVDMDGFVMDDGWDSHTRVWDFHEGFPDGFTKVGEAARSYGAGVGVWMSPWGGYGRAKAERMKNGKVVGLETNRKGFSMSGKNYGAHFKKTCVMMMKDYGVNHFKFDGMGGGNTSSGASAELADDINAILDMSLDLRKINPDLWINATVGTWPSPFWTRHVDSIWRQGADVGFKGEGNLRERWITYRDAFTYERIVQRGPLYPLNSLMFHGAVIAKRGPPGKMPLDEGSVRHEVRAAFGCGSGLQELYITPKMLTKQMWDDIADAAKWSQARLAVLYDKEQIYQLDVKKVFELPDTIYGKIQLVSPYLDQRVKSLDANTTGTLEVKLKPFEVLVFDAKRS